MQAVVGGIILVAYVAVFGYLGARMARKRNRDPSEWGITCAIFGLLGVIALLILGYKTGRQPFQTGLNVHGPGGKRYRRGADEQ